MTILGIETSCDETSASIITREETDRPKLISNIVSSSLALHAKTGGIIPEIAAREQIKLIIPVIKEALEQAKIKDPKEEIDAIAVTIGPGLMGSLLVGVETAKTLSYIWNKRLIPTNHLIGHLYANFIEQPRDYDKQTTARQKAVVGNRLAVDKQIEFPAIGLIVSGGHTDLVLIKNHDMLKWLGGTRDDAAGEALDKIGRLLGLPYPAGPHIENAAKNGDPKKCNFPSPLINSEDYDFSFSGLKTAAFRKIKSMNHKPISRQAVSDISASVQKAIIDVLIKKTLTAAEKYRAKSILLGGGVAANQTLRNGFELETGNWKLNIPLFIPEKRLCTDNAAMIAAAAFFKNQTQPWQKIDAIPNLYF